MRRMTRLVGMAVLAVATSGSVPGGVAAQSGASETLSVPGLTQRVEVIRDRWGLNHIYAQNEADLFLAQGYLAAKDRLFQFEVWRRRATGTVAEILGPRELDRDLGTRLHMYRGDMDAELNHYHPRGKQIIEAYVRGVNAYVDQAMRDPSALPVEFKMLGITPGKWTPAGGDLTPPGAHRQRAERSDPRPGDRRARQCRQAARAAAHRGRRAAADARSADRPEDVPGRRPEDLRRVPRSDRVRPGRRRCGVSRRAAGGRGRRPRQ